MFQSRRAAPLTATVVRLRLAQVRPPRRLLAQFVLALAIRQVVLVAMLLLRLEMVQPAAARCRYRRVILMARRVAA
jgi:hypothetical protein